MEVTEISQITSENFEGEVGTITIVGNLGTGQRVVSSVPAEAVVVEGNGTGSGENGTGAGSGESAPEGGETQQTPAE